MTQHATPPSAPAGQRVGYARVSSVDQNLERQLVTIGPVDRLFTDTFTGATRAQRTGLTELIAYVRAGDTVVVSSMDRLARSLRDLVDIVDEITAKGATLTFLTEGQTYRPGHNDPTSDLMLGLLGAVAQFERALIRERQTEGIAAARARGAYRGRARRLTDADVEQARARVATGVPKSQVARELGVHRSTLHRALGRQAE